MQEKMCRGKSCGIDSDLISLAVCHNREMASHQKNPQLISDLEDFLKTTIISLNPEPISKRGQPRILPALALWAGMLVAVLRGFNSQLELWRLLSSQGLWDFPKFTISDDAVYKRLKKA